MAADRTASRKDRTYFYESPRQGPLNVSPRQAKKWGRCRYLRPMLYQTESRLSRDCVGVRNECHHVAVAERLRQAYPTNLEWAGVGSIPANSDAQNVLSFRRWRFEMKLSPFFLWVRRARHRHDCRSHPSTCRSAHTAPQVQSARVM